MNGGLFILHGLICTVDSRITPHVGKFIDFLLCGLNMENCDAMGTRMSCGLISDLSNSIQGEIMHWMPQITERLQRILVDNSFDSEAKLVTIIAFGDLSLAAGAAQFMQYLPQTLNSFTQASNLSLQNSDNPEEITLLTNLRVALVEAYISILHGLVPDEDMPQLTDQQEADAEQFAFQMWKYLEDMVRNKDLQFPTELLKPMFELYLDISAIHVSKLN